MFGAGFCSVAEFAEEDLGRPLHADKTPPHIAAYMKVAAKAVAPVVAEPKIMQAATPVARAPTPKVRHMQPCVIPHSNANAYSFAASGLKFLDAFVSSGQTANRQSLLPPCRP